MSDNIQYILAWTPGWPELVVVLVIALLIFGKRLPEIARGLGKSLTEFKKGVSEAEKEKDELVNDIKNAKNDVVNEAKKASGLEEDKSEEENKDT